MRYRKVVVHSAARSFVAKLVASPFYSIRWRIGFWSQWYVTDVCLCWPVLDRCSFKWRVSGIITTTPQNDRTLQGSPDMKYCMQVNIAGSHGWPFFRWAPWQVLAWIYWTTNQHPALVYVTELSRCPCRRWAMVNFQDRKKTTESKTLPIYRERRFTSCSKRVACWYLGNFRKLSSEQIIAIYSTVQTIEKTGT